MLGVRRQAAGLTIDWAYAPTEMKVLASPDGANFVEAVPWQMNPNDIASFVDHMMFDASLPVATITVVMRNPRAWKYFGLNSVELIAEPGPTMLASGATSLSGPLCVVSPHEQHVVSLAPCLDTIAKGNGDEIFVLGDDGKLSSASDSSQCLMLASGEAGNQIVKSPCRYAADAGDGRGVLEPTPTGQLKFSKMGNYCASTEGDLLLKDIAIDSTTHATSNQDGHPPEHALDGFDDATYWASDPQQFANVTIDFTLDIGKYVSMDQIDIEWKMPAKEKSDQAHMCNFVFPCLCQHILLEFLGLAYVHVTHG